MNNTHLRIIVSALLGAACASAQPGVLTKELLIKYTPEWKGERFADGRPKVPDGVLKRLQSVTLEEAWAVIKQAGYPHQYEDNWFLIHPDKVLVGRALTKIILSADAGKLCQSIRISCPRLRSLP